MRTSVWIIRFKSSYVLMSSGHSTTRTARRHGVQKNGVHFGDTEGPEFNIADSSRLAEAWRLIAEVTAGEQLVFDVSLTPEVRSVKRVHRDASGQVQQLQRKD